MVYKKEFKELTWRIYLLSEKGRQDHWLYNIAELIDNSYASWKKSTLSNEPLEIVIKFSPQKSTIEYLDNSIGMYAEDWRNEDKTNEWKKTLNNALTPHKKTDDPNNLHVYGQGLKIALGWLGRKYVIKTKYQAHELATWQLDLSNIQEENREMEHVCINLEVNRDLNLPSIENYTFQHGTYISIGDIKPNISYSKVIFDEKKKNFNALQKLLEFRYAKWLKTGNVHITLIAEKDKAQKFDIVRLSYPSILDRGYKISSTFEKIYRDDLEKSEQKKMEMIGKIKLHIHANRQSLFLFNNDENILIDKLQNDNELLFTFEYTLRSLERKVNVSWRILPWKKSDIIKPYTYKLLTGLSIIANGRYILGSPNIQNEYIYSNNTSYPIYQSGDSSEYNGLQRVNFSIDLTEIINDDRINIPIMDNRIMTEMHKTNFVVNERCNLLRTDLQDLIQKIRRVLPPIMNIFLEYDDIIKNDELKFDFSYEYGSINGSINAGTSFSDFHKLIKNITK